MRKSIIFVLFSVLATVLVLYLKRTELTDYVRNYLYSVSVFGKVTDITNESPLELATLKVNNRETFSNYLGIYRFTKVGIFSGVSVTSPDDYEKYDSPLSCSKNYVDKSLEISFECNVSLYPTPELVAGRVEISRSFNWQEPQEQISSRHRQLWRLMSEESQKLFLGEDQYLQLMSVKEQIDAKRKLNQTTFMIEKAKRIDNTEYFDPLTKKVYKGVTEIPVIRTLVSGKTIITTDRFYRVEGIWRYISDFSSATLSEYINLYKWVLKLRD